MYLTVLIGMAVLGAYFGGTQAWRRGTDNLQRAIDVASAPTNMRGRDFRRIVRGQRKQRRLIFTLLWSVVGAVLGMSVAFGIALMQAAS